MVVVSAVVSQQEGSWFESQKGVDGVCMFSSCMRGFSLGTPASSCMLD